MCGVPSQAGPRQARPSLQETWPDSAQQQPRGQQPPHASLHAGGGNEGSGPRFGGDTVELPCRPRACTPWESGHSPSTPAGVSLRPGASGHLVHPVAPPAGSSSAPYFP